MQLITILVVMSFKSQRDLTEIKALFSEVSIN
jgi:hypothetical protein